MEDILFPEWLFALFIFPELHTSFNSESEKPGCYSEGTCPGEGENVAVKGTSTQRLIALV